MEWPLHPFLVEARAADDLSLVFSSPLLPSPYGSFVLATDPDSAFSFNGQDGLSQRRGPPLKSHPTRKSLGKLSSSRWKDSESGYCKLIC